MAGNWKLGKPFIMNKHDAEILLQQSLNNSMAEFRDGQWEAIDGVVNQRKKILVVQRTGWGKSSVYFIGTRMLRDRGAGPTLIVSPLLALMRNQIDAAKRLRINAVTINSTNQDEWRRVQQQIVDNCVDAVLISPERLSNPDFVQNILLPVANRIGLLVVDEAHCISDWGHDFRPDYKRLVDILKHMPPTLPVLGTTATANDRVVSDVQSQLGDVLILRGSLIRESLSLQNIRLPDQAARLAWLTHNIHNLPGTGIVYTLTKRDAEQVTGWLNQNDIDAYAYYSGVMDSDFETSNLYRQHLENQLLENKIKVLVATTALGMGYDKPDLSFVIHYQAPGSIVAYYQQVGRAGRGIDQAVGILLSGREDDEIHAFFRKSAFPDEVHVQEILSCLEQYDGLTIYKLQEYVNLTKGQIEKVLKFLNVENPAPVIKDGSQWRRTTVAYHMDHARVRRLTRQREIEWQEMQEYLDTQKCLMGFLCSALDDPETGTCGKCANCIDVSLFDPDIDFQLRVAAEHYLRHTEIQLKPKVQVAGGAFKAYGFKGNLPMNLRAELGRVLSRWGDAGWGRLVALNKHSEHFQDDLVDAVTEMIQTRWQPEIEWVTCVPSKNHPDLVPDFASRLAKALGLPFVKAIDKVRDNQQQKFQKNRFYQCRNLDGVFQIIDSIPAGPVLLVDDAVDSGWTLTVLAALLKQAGSGPVFPVALATTSPGG